MKTALILAALLLAIPATATESFQVLPLGEVWPTGWMKNQLTRDITTGYIGAYDRIQPSLGRNYFGPLKHLRVPVSEVVSV